ncbi:hypothetical protein DVS28_a4706 [Euzebya pacifica]|uniref:DUF3291 domain-containing protein n=1 Tax=Euzebya pacifica TaxID=1608957 RepID=A0A346Y4H0_9ACTN|nr:DUF3291 domain-containing protein [Euzebya pacifica]AXV09367.1 hypothetical protein DVS28_a4706 [Euzebya pacifica]
MEHHLAQANVAYALASLDSPKMAGFVRASAHVNRAADAADGFVWRLQDAAAVPFLGDERWVVNVSVWQSMAAFETFSFSDPHRRIMQLRSRWFEPHNQPATACWWVPAGHLPDLAEAHRQVLRLWEDGTSAEVFGLGTGVPPAPPVS